MDVDHLHALVGDKAICAAGLEIANEVSFSIDFHAPQDVFGPSVVIHHR
jgi:hypothetical protein